MVSEPSVAGGWGDFLAVAPKHLLFTGSSCVLFHGHFSPGRAVLFDRYFTTRCRGCFYFPHAYVYISCHGGSLPDAFPWCSGEAEELLRVHLGASLEQYLLKCEIHCCTVFLKPGPNQKVLLLFKNLLTWSQQILFWMVFKDGIYALKSINQLENF